MTADDWHQVQRLGAFLATALLAPPFLVALAVWLSWPEGEPRPWVGVVRRALRYLRRGLILGAVFAILGAAAILGLLASGAS